MKQVVSSNITLVTLLCLTGTVAATTACESGSRNETSTMIQGEDQADRDWASEIERYAQQDRAELSSEELKAYSKALAGLAATATTPREIGLASTALERARSVLGSDWPLQYKGGDVRLKNYLLLLRSRASELYVDEAIHRGDKEAAHEAWIRHIRLLDTAASEEPVIDGPSTRQYETLAVDAKERGKIAARAGNLNKAEELYSAARRYYQLANNDEQVDQADMRLRQLRTRHSAAPLTSPVFLDVDLRRSIEGRPLVEGETNLPDGARVDLRLVSYAGAVPITGVARVKGGFFTWEPLPTSQEPLTTGTYTADGPSSGNGCYTCYQASHADWFVFTAPADGTIDISSCRALTIERV